MVKRIFCIPIIFVLIFSVGIFSYAEENLYYNLIAEDNFDINVEHNTKLNTFYSDGGMTGTLWEGVWSNSTTDFSKPPSIIGGAIPAFRMDAKRKQIMVYSYGTNCSIYRKMAKSIELSKDGEYYISGVFYHNLDPKDTKKDYLDTRFIIGNLYGGIKYNSALNDYTAQLSVENDISYGNIPYKTQTYYTYLLKLDVNATSEDKVSFKIYEEGQIPPENWELEKTVELGSNQLTFIGYNPGNNIAHYVDDFKIEYYNPIIKNTVENLLTKDDCKNAIKYISYLPNNGIREKYFDIIKTFCEKNNFTEILTNSFNNSNIENQIVKADNFNKIEIETAFALDENSGSAVLSCDNEIIDIQMKTTKNIVTINLLSGLDMNKEYKLTLSNFLDFKGENVENYTFSFRTSMIPITNVMPNLQYGQFKKVFWIETPNVETTATISINGSNPKTFLNGDKLDVMGDCVLTLISKDKSTAFVETEKIPFTILEAFVPTAENVRISGDAKTDAVLRGEFDFIDKNNDLEGTHKYKWYSSLNKDAEYEEILGADQKTYTLKESDENKYIIFEVTPFSDSEALSEGKATKSQPFIGAFAPLAKDISIKGKMLINEKLTADFVYSDFNKGDTCDKHQYSWYLCDKKDDIGVKIFDSEELLLKKDYEDKYLYVGIKPKSNNKPYFGNEYFSEKIPTPTIPTATNVRIVGNSTVGSTLNGTYTFNDVNGDDDDGSILEWIDVSLNKVISNGKSITLENDGASIAFRVTPKSNNEPFLGKAIQSETVIVSESSSSGGGFNYAGSSSGSVKTEIREPEPIPTPKDEEFKDIAGHWAEKYIIQLKKDNIVNGVSADLFKPDKEITRAEFISMLAKALKADPIEYKGEFSDVKFDDWYSSYVAIALKKGWISIGDTFRPTVPITREEGAKILSIAIGKSSVKTKVLEYSDKNNISLWATEYVNNITALGIMKGNTNGEFLPFGKMTRAQIATVIYRIINAEVSFG